MSDPLAGSPWSAPTTVAGFVASPPNPTLLAMADAERRRAPGGHVIDIGCGAGRNAVPLAGQGWHVLGTDLSRPMLAASVTRVPEARAGRLQCVLAPMDALPARTAGFDLIVAHGIWNLARSTAEFRRAVAEAARVAAADAALFVFTFSRHTLPPDAVPVSGERFVYTQFSGTPQCFLTRAQLVEEMAEAGFVEDAAIPFTEHNLPEPGRLHARRTPVIFEAAFRRTGATTCRSDAGRNGRYA